MTRFVAQITEGDMQTTLERGVEETFGLMFNLAVFKGEAAKKQSEADAFSAYVRIVSESEDAFVVINIAPSCVKKIADMLAGPDHSEIEVLQQDVTCEVVNIVSHIIVKVLNTRGMPASATLPKIGPLRIDRPNVETVQFSFHDNEHQSITLDIFAAPPA